MEAELVQREKIPFRAIPAAGLHGVGLRSVPGNLVRLARGYFSAQKIIREFHPDVMLFTGGYVGVPVAAAGRKIPSVVFVPDLEPGQALRTIGRFARRIAVSVEDSRQYFPNRDRVAITGYPTRPDLGKWDRAAARRELQIDADLPLILVTGGSKGAVGLNSAVYPILTEILAQARVLHLTGSVDFERASEVRRQLPASLADRYLVHPYMHEMGAAFAAADIAVCRAGASTLGELPLFGLPAVLVPYPYAWRYQKANAAYLAGHGAGLYLEQAYLPNRLLPTLQGLLTDPRQLASMRQAMLALARPLAAGQIGGLIRDIAARQPESRE